MKDIRYKFAKKVYKPVEPKPFPPKNPCKWQRAILELISKEDQGRSNQQSYFKYLETQHRFKYRFLRFIFNRLNFWIGIHTQWQMLRQWQNLKEELENIVTKDWSHDNQRNALLDKLERGAQDIPIDWREID